MQQPFLEIKVKRDGEEGEHLETKEFRMFFLYCPIMAFALHESKFNLYLCIVSAWPETATSAGIRHALSSSFRGTK